MKPPRNANQDINHPDNVILLDDFFRMLAQLDQEREEQKKPSDKKPDGEDN